MSWILYLVGTLMVPCILFLAFSAGGIWWGLVELAWEGATGEAGNPKEPEDGK